MLEKKKKIVKNLKVYISPKTPHTAISSLCTGTEFGTESGSSIGTEFGD